MSGIIKYSRAFSFYIVLILLKVSEINAVVICLIKVLDNWLVLSFDSSGFVLHWIFDIKSRVSGKPVRPHGIICVKMQLIEFHSGHMARVE